MKHFEHIWEESEQLSKDKNNNLSEIVENTILLLRDIASYPDDFKKIELLGNILYNISSISFILNVNVYSALKEFINDIKFKALEKSEGDLE
jgi:hypothetical protein